MNVMVKKRATYNVREDQRARLERIALELSQEEKQIVTWSEVVRRLIDKDIEKIKATIRKDKSKSKKQQLEETKAKAEGKKLD